MKLNLNTEDITIENYKKTLNLIEEFKVEISKKIKTIQKEQSNMLIESKRANAIRGIERCEIHNINRDSLQTLFIESIIEMGFDEYGKYEKSELEDNTYENSVFLLRPYSWSDGDCTCGLDEEESDLFYENKNKNLNINTDIGFHSIDCYNSSDRIVNFWHKPTNLKIHWYKYPFRSASSNQEITYEYLEAIMNDCKKSMLNDVKI